MLKPPRTQSVWFLSAFVLKPDKKDGLGPFLVWKVLLERVQASPGTLHKNVQYFYTAWAQADFEVLIRCKNDVGLSSKSGAFRRALSQAQSKLNYLLPRPNSPALSAVVLWKLSQKCHFPKNKTIPASFKDSEFQYLSWFENCKVNCLSLIRCIFNKSL